MKIAVIGGGPAGLIAAGKAAENFENFVTLFDRNEKAGKKLYITGKGRCNVTNLVSSKDFMDNIVSNPKFLFSSIQNFTPYDTVDFLSSQGIKTKVERGNRVFPESDKASDITKALVKYALKNRVLLKTNVLIDAVLREGNSYKLSYLGTSELFDSVVIACGGKSYSSTGSDGKGYHLAKQLGHSIVPVRPALVPIRLTEDVSSLQGLSLKNVSVSVCCASEKYEQFGEMLFTKDGVSGPIILTLSSLINRKNLNQCKLKIDLKPKLSMEVLDARILKDFEKNVNKVLKNSLNDLLPLSLIPYIIKVSNLDGLKPIHSVTKDERNILIKNLKELTFTVKDLYDIECAIVTAGGVSVTELNPKTMESKFNPGLFFAGEMVDVDAFTGGFNIQIALSTGYAAGKCLKERKENE